jgi:hypothetical protein
VWIYARTTLTNLEIGLLQVVFLSISVGTSFLAGRLSLQGALQDAIRPHGAKGIRRIQNLGIGITTFGRVVDLARENIEEATDPSTGTVPSDRVMWTLDTLQILIGRELQTAADAVEDWQDVVPDEIRHLRERAQEGDAAS